jgi:hypothetical protein
MKSARAIPLFLSVTAVAISIAACGGGGGTPIPISVSFGPQPPGSVVAGSVTSITAVVSNDPANRGVNWTVTCGSSSCGSFNPMATSSGTATSYTAPSSVPSGNTVTITATSQSSSSATASATITVTTTAPTVLNNGNYIYNATGDDANGPYFIAGAFTVLNGAVTGGEQDFSDNAAAFTNTLVASGSNLSITSDGNIQIALDTGNTSIGENGVETLRGTVVSSSRVLISEFDSFAAASGSLDLQTGTSAPSAGYAFAVNGLDGSGNPLAIGGILDINGSSLVIANSVFDLNDAGSGLLGQTFASGSVGAPDNFGRVTFSLTPSASSGVSQFVLTGYIIGTNRIWLVESQLDALGGNLGGTALGQGANTGAFTTGNVAGTYASGTSGQDVNGLIQIAAALTLNTNSSVTGNLALNDLTAFGGSSITNATWALDTRGRVTISNVLTSFSSTPFAFQLYLDGSGNALQIGVDTLQVTEGFSYKQTSTTGLNVPAAGNYALGGLGFANVTNLPAWSAVGLVSVTSSAISGFTDYTVQNSQPMANNTLTGTVNNTLASMAISGLSITTNSANTYGSFPIDNTRTWALEIDGQQLGLLIFEGAP